MNRRNFIRNILVAGASFAVLPPASTYDRIWKVKRKGFWHPMLSDGFPYHRLIGNSTLCPGITDWQWFQAMVDAPVEVWESDIGNTIRFPV